MSEGFEIMFILIGKKSGDEALLFQRLTNYRECFMENQSTKKQHPIE
jgi:hypothetical protein